MGVDLDRLLPYPLVGGRSTYGGYSGAGIKPIGLKAVSQLARAVPLPIHGMGGIRTWSDAAEYLALGAGVVQVCTEVMVKGFRIIDGLTEGLASYLETKDLTASGLCGRALPALSRHEDLTRDTLARPWIDGAACVTCGRCVTACRDGGYQAISFKDRKIVFDTDRCDGCSLCSQVCPQGAIVMEPAPSY
jgi:dihydropyrimidine dehydrogenase (NAD+) subunit PreA